MESLIQKILISHSLPLEEAEKVSNEITEAFKTASEDEKNQIREAVMKNTKALMASIAETQRQAEALLAEMERTKQSEQ
jgi:hypothetical protein